jgi:hypothetical protein
VGEKQCEECEGPIPNDPWKSRRTNKRYCSDKCRYRARDRARYAKDPEQARERSRRYYAENRERVLAKARARREHSGPRLCGCGEPIHSAMSRYCAAHGEEAKERRRARRLSRRLRACEVCGTRYRPSYGRQRTCGRACGVTLKKASHGRNAGHRQPDDVAA